MTSRESVLAYVRFHMMQGEVEEAVEALGRLWLEADGDLAALHATTLELADRFPLSGCVADLLHRATAVYARKGDFVAATGTAARMVSVWRARCQVEASADALAHHVHALDTLAAVYRVRGMTDEVVGCLVELVEWHLVCGNDLGVAWALRELGVMAFNAGDLDNAARKLHSADELYAKEADDPSVAEERAECHVLLGKLARAQENEKAARKWFGEALRHLTGEAAEEVRAIARGSEARITSEFGKPFWDKEKRPTAA